MADQLTNALLATIAGGLVAVLLFTPVAAWLYRRDGRFSFGSVLVLGAAAVYFFALWTYTLLPLPAADEVRCAGSQLVPFGSLNDILERDTSSVGGLLRNQAFQQVILNVALFMPLGFFVRRIARRGVLVAGLSGLAISALIEFSQLTGLWGLYDCAYRVFDVDDMLTNTTGAVVGSLLAALVVSREPDETPLPDHVTLGRRLMSVLCDGVVIVVVGYTLGVLYRVWAIYGQGAPAEIYTWEETALVWSVVTLWQLAVVLRRGRTIGEWAVAVRPVRKDGHSPLNGTQRLVKFAAGVGAACVLQATPTPAWIFWTFVALTLVASIPGRNHPGLANSLAGAGVKVQKPGS